jgi:hypothetical protein
MTYTQLDTVCTDFARTPRRWRPQFYLVGRMYYGRFLEPLQPRDDLHARRNAVSAEKVALNNASWGA